MTFVGELKWPDALDRSDDVKKLDERTRDASASGVTAVRPTMSKDRLLLNKVALTRSVPYASHLLHGVHIHPNPPTRSAS